MKINELTYCPSLLTVGYATYSPKAVEMLFGGEIVSPYIDFSIGKKFSYEIKLSDIKQLSVSGVQEKYAAVVENGKIRLALKDEQGGYILKPPPSGHLAYVSQLPANEHLTMQIANQIYGIETAQNGICIDQKGQAVYIVKRFDVYDGGKYQQEDFASILMRTTDSKGEFKYNGTYSDIAQAIKRIIPDYETALDSFFKLLVFNYIFANGDAHLKNFSILIINGEPHLAPAYDLINTSLHINDDDFALKGGFDEKFEKSETYQKTGHPCKTDFYNFAISIGVNDEKAKDIIAQFEHFAPETFTLIDRSFITNQAVKRQYKRIIEHRRRRFVRQ